MSRFAHDIARMESLHEAGHAVATVALGGILDYVNLQCSVEAEDSPLDPWSRAVAAAAGAAAVQELGPRVRDISREMSAQDRAIIDLQVERLGNVFRYNRARAVEEARSLVRAHERRINLVAKALRERGSLSHDDVCEIMASARVGKVNAASTTVATARHAEPVRIPVVTRSEPNGWVADEPEDVVPMLPYQPKAYAATREEALAAFRERAQVYLQRSVVLDVRDLAA